MLGLLVCTALAGVRSRAWSMGCRMAGCDCTMDRSAWNCGLERKKSNGPACPPPPAAAGGCAHGKPCLHQLLAYQVGLFSPSRTRGCNNLSLPPSTQRQ